MLIDRSDRTRRFEFEYEKGLEPMLTKYGINTKRLELGSPTRASEEGLGAHVNEQKEPAWSRARRIQERIPPWRR